MARIGSIPLADTLELLLPRAEQTALLRVCLLRDDAIAEAWEHFQGGVSDPKQFLMDNRNGVKRHLQLLYTNLTRHNIQIGRNLEPYLRTAHMREQMRSNLFRKSAGSALIALRDADIDCIVLRGTALSESAYDDPALRHCHDIDLLMTEDQIPGACEALRALTFTPTQDPAHRGNVRLDHESGLPIELHTQFFNVACYTAPLADIRERKVPVTINGIPAMTTSPADMLVHVCAHASTVHRRDALSWVVDACMLLKREPQLNWDIVLDVTKRSGAALPVFVMLDYLAQHYDAPIPAPILDELRVQSRHVSGAARIAALDGVHRGIHGTVGNLLRHSHGRSRLTLWRWMLLRPRRVTRWAYHHRHGRRLRHSRLLKPLRFLYRHIKSYLRSSSASQPMIDGRTQKMGKP